MYISEALECQSHLPDPSHSIRSRILETPSRPGSLSSGRVGGRWTQPDHEAFSAVNPAGAQAESPRLHRPDCIARTALAGCGLQLRDPLQPSSSAEMPHGEGWRPRQTGWRRISAGR